MLVPMTFYLDLQAVQLRIILSALTYVHSCYCIIVFFFFLQKYIGKKLFVFKIKSSKAPCCIAFFMKCHGTFLVK